MIKIFGSKKQKKDAIPVDKVKKEVATITIPAKLTVVPIRESITRNTIMEYLNTFGLTSSLTKNETEQFIQIAVAFNLNPFKREIYCIPYEMKDGTRKLSIITGYETYLKRAERTGLLAGWSSSTTGSKAGRDLKAVVKIFRKDWKEPFVHEVCFEEYDQNNRMWIGKPKTMIKKVVTAQGFRLCFPEEFGGMPYTSDELPDEMTTEKNVTPEKTEEVKPSIESKTETKSEFEKPLKPTVFDTDKKPEKVLPHKTPLSQATLDAIALKKDCLEKLGWKEADLEAWAITEGHKNWTGLLESTKIDLLFKKLKVLADAKDALGDDDNIPLEVK